MKKLPIGVSDFNEVIEGQYYYVDKTLLVKELLEATGKILLIPRPRRFGKTLNLSMLRYFFEQTPADTSYLFTDTAIWQHDNYKSLQGKYPVIFLTFKDIKNISWQDVVKKIAFTIAQEYNQHRYLLLSELFEAFEKDKFDRIRMEKASEVELETSLFFLSELLYRYHQCKVIILIDEYDQPIHEGFTQGYYLQIASFLRSFLSAALKDNIYLERGVLTGILRTAKEGIFSGLNNLQVYTIVDKEFSHAFGFTKQEVQQLLGDYNLLNESNEIQQWYNGYTFGQTTVYNPWSLLSCVSKQGLLKPYWLNTSDNQLVKKLITASDENVKKDLEFLLSCNTLDKEIDEAVIFPGIEHNPKALWSLLLFTGYLTYTHLEYNNEGAAICSLSLPNKEIKILYTNLIRDIFEQSLNVSKVQALLTALTTGDSATFAQLLQEFISSSMSFYDLPNDEPEKSYHLFILGLLVLLADTHEIKSNRESGFGRYDIMIIPNQADQLATVIEFKKVAKQETLEIAAHRALEQIKDKNYVQELTTRGIKHIQLFGIAFLGKQTYLACETLNRKD